VWEQESQDGGLQSQLPNVESPTLPTRNLSAALGDVESQETGLTSARASLNGAARDCATMSRQDHSPVRHAPRRGSLSLADSAGEPGETQAASYGGVEDATPRRKALIKMAKSATLAALEAREEIARFRKVRVWKLRLSILTCSLLRRVEGSARCGGNLRCIRGNF
jgi:hypothetical protein